jgi:signal transduction histidine kinase
MKSFHKPKDLSGGDDDNFLSFEITMVPCIICYEPSVLIVLRDVTHFNQVEVLKKFNENKTKMLYKIAHEIRNPLNCINLMLQNMQGLCKKNYQYRELTKTVNSAYSASSFLKFLMNDLLDMA